MRVLVVSDRFDGAVTAPVAADAVAAGWRRQRPDDEVSTLALSTGGAGLCEVLAREGDRWLDVEVVGPRGLPVDARALLRADGVGVVEAAAACGAGRDGTGRVDPGTATTFGVGQLLRAVIDAGADRVLVGVGDLAVVDAGLGALTGFGYRLRVADGSGLKIGGGEIHRLDRIEPGWAPAVSGVDIEVLVDTSATLTQAADRLAEDAAEIAGALPRWHDSLAHVATILERDLPGPAGATATPGAGAGGGLAAALGAAVGARLVPGAEGVADLLGLPDAMTTADVVVVAQEVLDGGEAERTGFSVLGSVRRTLRPGAGTTPLAVVHHLDVGERGGERDGTIDAGAVVDVEQVSGTAWHRDPTAALAQATSRLAARR